MPPLVRSRTARACGSSTAHAGHAAGSCGSAGTAASTRAAAACSHWAASSAGELGAGDGLHQAVHQHQAVPGRGDQRVAAQRGDRIPGRHRITQQRPDRGRHFWAQQARSLLTGQQQGQRHRFGRQERQQPHQPRRRRASPASRDNASPSVAATSAGCPAASPRASRSACRARNSGRYLASVVPVACI